MKQARWFETILAALLVVLTCLLYIAIVSTPSTTSSSWEKSSLSLDFTGSFDYLYAGNNDVLYGFRGNDIYAIDKNGNLLWKYSVPGEWTIIRDWMSLEYTTNYAYGTGLTYVGRTDESRPVLCEQNGQLYIYAYKFHAPDNSDNVQESGNPPSFLYDSVVLGISPQGKLEWEAPLISGSGIGNHDLYRTADISKRADRLYIYDSGTEYVLDERGNHLFNIPDVLSPGAVDESGYIYALKSRVLEPSERNDSLPHGGRPEGSSYWMADVWNSFFSPGYTVPSSIVETYGPNGSLAWRTDVGVNVTRAYVTWDQRSKYGSLPIYANHTLYLPVENGVAALDTSGNVKWIRQMQGGIYYIMFDLMPADSHGNVYLNTLWASASDTGYVSRPEMGFVATVGPNGRDYPDAWEYDQWPDQSGYYVGPLPLAGNEGIVYAVTEDPTYNESEFSGIVISKRYLGSNITAYDVKNNSVAWQFEVPAEDVHTATLDQQTLYQANLLDSWAIGPDTYDRTCDMNERQVYRDASTGLEERPVSQAKLNSYVLDNVRVYPGKNIVYVDYEYGLYQYPVIFNRSQFLYSRTLYALDNNGELLWKKPLEDHITMIAANNDTFYYFTDKGRFGGGTTDLATGVAAASIIYLILRFLAIGAVSRARNRLDKNDNRNSVLKYIVGHPGQTAREISRSLDMNLGTLRYHLLILGVNHKIVAHGDDKYQRYFVNSGAYTGIERTLLSLMHRDPVRRMLEVLAEKPGISSQALSKELNTSMTVTHKHVTLLVRKGVVERTAQPDRSYLYAIRDEYRLHVEKLAERL